MTADLPGEHGRPLSMRSEDDRGPAYTAAAERSEAAFAAVRGVLGDRPRLVDDAGELADLAAAWRAMTAALAYRARAGACRRAWVAAYVLC